MRFATPLLVLVLIAAAVVMYLNAHSAKSALESVTNVAVDLREADATAAGFDSTQARRVLSALESLAAQPEQAASHVDDLQAIAARAADWARGAPVPSTELHAAVCLRSAADALRAYALRPSAAPLATARDKLAEARGALAGQVGRPGAIGGLEDQIENLDRAHQEQLQGLDEELGRQPTPSEP
jgi:hypothetical protein